MHVEIIFNDDVYEVSWKVANGWKCRRFQTWEEAADYLQILHDSGNI